MTPKLSKEHCIYRIGNFRLDARAKVLLRGDDPVRMPLKATEILLVLVQHSGEVVTKDELLNAVWPDKVVDEANLKQNIAVIRKILDSQPGSPVHIETFVGRGYRIVGTAEEVIATPPAEVPAPGPHMGPPPPSTGRRKFSWWMAAPVFCIVLAVGAAVTWRSNANSSAPSTVSRVSSVTRLQGSESQPAVSPDGRRVAFLWQQKDGKPPAAWVKSLDREDPIRIGSRDGRHSSPVWSPDGKALAYLWIGIDRTEVLLAGAEEGSGERVLAAFPYSSYVFRQRLLDWSPDGKWLCLSLSDDPKHSSQLFLIDAQTGKRRPLTPSESPSGNDVAPRFSPDGLSVSYIRHIGRTEQELRIVPVSGGASRKLASEGKRITDQDWTAGGKAIIFSSDRSGEFRLWRIGVQPTAAKPSALEVFGEYPLDISIARHANVLVYSAETEDRNIWRLDLKDKRWDRVIASSAQDASPQYSPDGSRICFRSNRSGVDQLWLADASGEHPMQLTTGALSPNFGHWSPDGQAIVFNDSSSGINVATWQTNRWNIRQLRIKGSHPVFAQDGKAIYAGTPSGLMRIPLDEGPGVAISPVRAFSLALSLDGKWIYFVGENGGEVWRVPVEGGPATKVLDGLLPGCTSCWAVAPNGIYYLRAKNSLDEQSLYYIDFATGKNTEIEAYPEPLVPLGSGPFSLSPDFRYLLCVRTELPGGDLMKIEPFR